MHDLEVFNFVIGEKQQFRVCSNSIERCQYYLSEVINFN